MEEHNIPNTFITDDGNIIFCNAWEYDEEQLSHIAECEMVINKVEKKYGTSDIKTMMLEGISRKLLIRYMDAKHDLTVLYGF